MHELGKINFTDLYSYIQLYKIDDFETFVIFIQSLNNEFVMLMSERQQDMHASPKK